MRLFHLNCQGLGNTLTIQYLKDIRKSYTPDIMFLIETKNGYDVVDKLCKDLNYAHSFVIPANGRSRGLAIFWNVFVQLTLVSNPQVYHSDMYIRDGTNIFCLSYIYDNFIEKYRSSQWNNMISMVDSDIYRNMPRLAFGDFNDIKHMSEKEGGAYRSEAI